MTFPFKKLAPVLLIAAFAGCIGFNPDEIFDKKPYTYVSGGAQIGRDQLANRWLVAQKKLPMKGKNQNEVLTYLGQPQNVQIVEHHISEDWLYIYYKRYKTAPETPKGSFLIRFYNDEVIDIVSDPYTAQP